MLGIRILLVMLSFGVGTMALAAGISVTERTRNYRVAGNNIQAVVRSMKRNGPLSQFHGRRALGLADYRYRTAIKTKVENGRCHVTDASIKLRIFYVLPKLSTSSKLNRRDQSKWRAISSMIKRHEDQHGRFYRRFAAELQKSLVNMKPQKNCNQFKKLEQQLRARHEKSNTRRNRSFDRNQYKPFNRRLKRLAPKRVG